MDGKAAHAHKFKYFFFPFLVENFMIKLLGYRRIKKIPQKNPTIESELKLAVDAQPFSFS